MYCPSCKRWEITQFDSFCSWCRTKLVDFGASFNVDHLCVGDIAPDTLTLTLTHTGCVGTIRVERIDSPETWLKPRIEQVADLFLQVGKDIEVPVEVDLLTPTDDYHEVRVVITSDVGGSREAVLEVTPRPATGPRSSRANLFPAGLINAPTIDWSLTFTSTSSTYSTRYEEADRSRQLSTRERCW